MQPFEVHKKGEMIVKNGADLGLLASSVCFELSPAEAKRQEQMNFNQALVNASDGLLHFSGKEKFGTVAKSHSSQFVKAILHGCKTPGSLGVNGCLCKETLCRTDDQLKHMVEVGWPWLIVSFKVEEALPSLPSLATLACNSTNSNFEAWDRSLFKVWCTPNSCRPTCCLSPDWLCSQQIWLHLRTR